MHTLASKGWMCPPLSKWVHQTAFCGISAQIGAFYLRLRSRSLPGLACQTPTHQPPIVLFGKRLPSNFTTFPSSHSCWQRCICEMCNPTSIPLISSCPGCLLHYKRDALQTSLLASAVARSKEGRRRKRPIQCMRFQKPM